MIPLPQESGFSGFLRVQARVQVAFPLLIPSSHSSPSSGSMMLSQHFFVSLGHCFTSSGQLRQVSPGSGMSFPQTELQTPTSFGQVRQVSPGSYFPFPQVVHSFTSSGQLRQVSPGSGMLFPQTEVHSPTSSGQVRQVSPGSTFPFPQVMVLVDSQRSFSSRFGQPLLVGGHGIVGQRSWLSGMPSWSWS